MTKHRNISRVDTGRAQGWRVRFEQGPIQFTKLFSDRPHGGSENALQSALGFRDTWRDKLRTNQHDLGTDAGDTNTGYVGITYHSPTGFNGYFMAEVLLDSSDAQTGDPVAAPGSQGEAKELSSIKENL